MLGAVLATVLVLGARALVVVTLGARRGQRKPKTTMSFFREALAGVRALGDTPYAGGRVAEEEEEVQYWPLPSYSGA